MGDIKDLQTRIDYYKYIHTFGGGIREPRWRGARVVKFPQDLILYSQVIFKRKPDYIIETGTAYGGSAMFFGDMLMLSGGKKVFSIDIKPKVQPPAHPFVEYFLGSSTDPSIVDKIKQQINGSVMAVLDSDHRSAHVLKEMEIYSEIVTSGQYMVVEDCYTRKDVPFYPYHAVKKFMEKRTDFKLYNLEKQFIFAVTMGGWLRKR